MAEALHYYEPGSPYGVAVSADHPLPVVIESTASNVGAGDMLYRILDTNGDGTGTKNAVGDYGTPEDFYIEAPAGYTYFLNRLLVHIGDASTLNGDEYGNKTALSIGATLKVLDGATEVLDILDGLTIQKNADWGRVAYDVHIFDEGTGDNYVMARLTFGAAGSPLKLDPGQRLCVRLSDDMTGIDEQYFKVQGYRIAV